ncbi:MAG: efflux RND transporter periplasmic adaptor subunit [Alphaproteobacteria bacterium]|nr:efflux RND transporter periplasmic adaptor subunit [Alphaproteobacteria bacterium]
MSPENETLRLKWRLRRAAIGAVCVLGAILVFGFYSRLVQASDLKDWTRGEEIPTVALISPSASVGGDTLSLPGTLQAYYAAPIYSRVPGYVHAWYKDIGAHVRKGDLLATIDTPELDQQIAQARADLKAAQAARALSSTTAERWQSLLPLDAVSRQDAEEKEEDLASKVAAVNAARANLDRLDAMKAFARIVAPFDGVVTRRTADIGNLVTAGPASNGDPLFEVADMHVLRVYVNVPQSYSAQIGQGAQASLTVPEYPGRRFQARLVSTAGAISDQSSTMLVEFQVANGQNLLKPGDFAQVAMKLAGGSRALRVPASALMFRAAGMEVATVGPHDRVVMKPITIATDLGPSVIVSTGLAPSDRLIDNPPDSLSNGDPVRIQAAGDAH